MQGSTVLRIGEMFRALLPFVLVAGCQDMPAERVAGEATGTIEVRVSGIAPDVEVLELVAGVHLERVVLSNPAAGRNVVLPEMPSGQTTVEVRGMRGGTTIQVSRVEVIVREDVVSILSVNLGFPREGEVPVVDGGVGPGPADAGDVGDAGDAGDVVDGGGEEIESDEIMLTFNGRSDFSIGPPGVLRGVTAGDPAGAYQTFLTRAAAILAKPGSSIGVSAVFMRLVTSDDLVLEEIYQDFSLRLEGPMTGTSTLASYPMPDDTTGWFPLEPADDLSVAQPDLRNGGFDVALQGPTPLDGSAFDGRLEVRMIFYAR